MAKRGRVSVWLGPPGFASIEEVLRRASAQNGAIIVSSNVALLAQIRDAVAREHETQSAYEKHSLDIKSLPDLVRMLSDAAELPMSTVAGPEHQAALLGLICNELPDDSPFAKARSLPGFHRSLASTLQEMRHAAIPTSALNSTSPKLRAIARIDELLEQALAQHRLSTLSERIEKVVEAKPCKLANVRHIYWVGESEMPALLIKLAERVVVSGVALTFFAENHPADPGFFPLESTLRSAFPDLAAALLGVSPPRGIGLFSELPMHAGDGEICTVRAADEYVETEWVLAKVAERIELGAPAHDICIYARSLDRYGPLLEAAAMKLRVPLAMARRERIETNSFAQQVALALQYGARSMLAHYTSLATSGYSGVSKGDRDIVAGEIADCRRVPAPMDALIEKAKDPDSAVPEWLGRVIAWQKKAARKQVTLSEWIRGLNVLISMTPWLDSGTKDDGAAQDAMVRALAVRRFIEGNQEMGLPRFQQICAECWRDNEYTIRTQVGVRVASSPFAIGPASLLFVMGALESQMPGRRAEDPILLDRDRAEIATVEAEWKLETSYEVAEERRRDFFRLVCGAPEIWITHPEQIDDSDEVSSAFLNELEVAGLVSRRMSISFEERFPRPQANVPPGLMTTAAAWYGTQDFDPGEIVRESLSQMHDAVRAASQTTIEDSALREELGRVPEPLQFHHLRALRRCPFQYYASVVLGFRAKSPRWAWTSLASVVRKTDLIHASEESLPLALNDSLQQHLAELSGSVPEDELDVVAIAGSRALAEFAHREFEARKEWKLAPVAQNVRLADALLHDTLPIDSGLARFDESIDVLYKDVNNVPVPMQLSAFAANSSSDPEFELNAGLLLLMSKSGADETKAVLDSVTSGHRKLIVRRRGDTRAATKNKHSAGLFTDSATQSVGARKRVAHEDLKALLRAASAGEPTATPGRHCQFCDYGGLCRQAPAGNLYSESWEGDEDNG